MTVKKALYFFICLCFGMSVITADLWASDKNKAATAKEASKSNFLSVPETTKILKNLKVMQGNFEYVKSGSTSEKSWRVHLYRVRNDNMFLPLVVYVNDRDVVVGVLVRNGKVVVPNIPVDEMQPTIKVDASRLTSKGRKVFNSGGQETVYMFSDPNCPHSKKFEDALPDYKGKYKVVIKHFPLDELFPGSTQKAIDRQCQWMGAGCDAESAKKIVEEDLEQGRKIGVNGTPFFITAKGNIINGLPDLR